MTALAIALAGAAGAAARLVVDAAVSARVGGRLPWGTLTVNLLGSLGAGLLAGAAFSAVNDALRVVLSTGFFGAFTTFSTFAVETVQLVEGDQRGAALTNVAANTLACALAAVAGLAVGGGL